MPRTGPETSEAVVMTPNEPVFSPEEEERRALSAENAREAGIYEVWMRLSTGKLKVFRSCRNWLDEFRIFARDENGKIINEQKFHHRGT